MKISLIFDSNFLFHKTKSIWMTYNKFLDLTQAFEKPEDRAKFLTKVIIDFCYAVSTFQKAGFEIEKIVLVFDEKTSWRKSYYEDYKKKERDETDAEGWTHFYELITKFQKLFVKQGFIVSTTESAEGDDLCYKWSKVLNNPIIISGDKDSLQFVKGSVMVYNNRSSDRILYVDEDSERFIKIFKEKSFDVQTINSERFILKKILVGDKGDNVPNVYRGLGDKTADKIVDLCFSFLGPPNFNDEDYIIKLFIVIDSVKKGLNESEITNNIKRNVKLMYLHDSVYDPKLLQKMDEEIAEKIDKFTYTDISKVTLTDILERTKLRENG